MATIDLWLDDYNDIYSDFDPRNYHKRRISVDFIDELRMALSNNEEKPSGVILLLPEEKRDREQEKLITESLHNFFGKRKGMHDRRVRKKRTGAWLLLLGGVLTMAAGSVITYKIEEAMWSQFLKVLVEPAGWFMLWSGLDALFYELKKLRKEARFFRELAVVDWEFQTTRAS